MKNRPIAVKQETWWARCSDIVDLYVISRKAPLAMATKHKIIQLAKA